MDQLVSIGRIARSHGLEGEIAVKTTSTELESIEQDSVIFIELDSKPVPFFVRSIRPHNKYLLFKLDGVEDASQVEKLKGKEMLMERSSVAEIDDQLLTIEGFEVVDQEIGRLGEVIRVDVLPGQEIMIVQYKGQEVLIPMVDPIVLDIDEDELLINVNCPEGLLDLNLG